MLVKVEIDFMLKKNTWKVDWYLLVYYKYFS